MTEADRRASIRTVRLRDIVMCFYFFGLSILVIPSFVMSIYAVAKLNDLTPAPTPAPPPLLSGGLGETFNGRCLGNYVSNGTKYCGLSPPPCACARDYGELLEVVNLTCLQLACSSGGEFLILPP